MLSQIKVTIYIFFISILFIFSTYSKDLISYDEGGKVVHWTSQDDINKAKNLIDSDTKSYWSTSNLSFPQVLTYAFPENKRFEAIIIKAKNGSDARSWAKEIRISTADPFPHMGGWIEIERLLFSSNGEEKVISFEGMRGRYFRIEIFSNFGSDTSISLGSFQVLDKL